MNLLKVSSHNHILWDLVDLKKNSNLLLQNVGFQRYVGSFNTAFFFLFNLNLFAYTETSQLTANLLPLLVETDIRMCFARK